MKARSRELLYAGGLCWRLELRHSFRIENGRPLVLGARYESYSRFGVALHRRKSYVSIYMKSL